MSQTIWPGLSLVFHVIESFSPKASEFLINGSLRKQFHQKLNIFYIVRSGLVFFWTAFALITLLLLLCFVSIVTCLCAYFATLFNFLGYNYLPFNFRVSLQQYGLDILWLFGSGNNWVALLASNPTQDPDVDCNSINSVSADHFASIPRSSHLICTRAEELPCEYIYLPFSLSSNHQTHFRPPRALALQQRPRNRRGCENASFHDTIPDIYWGGLTRVCWTRSPVQSSRCNGIVVLLHGVSMTWWLALSFMDNMFRNENIG